MRGRTTGPYGLRARRIPTCRVHVVLYASRPDASRLDFVVAGRDDLTLTQKTKVHVPLSGPENDPLLKFTLRHLVHIGKPCLGTRYLPPTAAPRPDLVLTYCSLGQVSILTRSCIRPGIACGAPHRSQRAVYGAF